MFGCFAGVSPSPNSSRNTRTTKQKQTHKNTNMYDFYYDTQNTNSKSSFNSSSNNTSSQNFKIAFGTRIDVAPTGGNYEITSRFEDSQYVSPSKVHGGEKPHAVKRWKRCESKANFESLRYIILIFLDGIFFFENFWNTKFQDKIFNKIQKKLFENFF